MLPDELPADVMLRALLDAMESAAIGCTIVVDRGSELRRVYSNSAAAAIFGQSVEEFRRTPPMLPLTQEERVRLGKMRSNMAAGVPSPAVIETRIERADGQTIPIEVSLGVVPLVDGRATVAFLRDIAAREAMAAALRESEERFRRLAEVAPDSIAVYQEGRCMYANPNALRLAGAETAEQIMERVPADLLAPRRIDALREQLGALKSGEHLPPHEVRLRTSDGQDLVLEVTLARMDYRGQPATVSFSRDVTQQRVLQARMMQQDRLAAVGTLAAGVAHEINNPLAYVLMILERLRTQAQRGESIEDAAREALPTLLEGAGRMKEIVADLLFMSRSADDPQSFVDVRRILESAITLARAGSPVGDAIDARLENVPEILGHASRLGQVLLNVLLNALQALENAGHVAPRIVVELRAQGDGLEVEVRDNGPGISREIMPHVFDPFFTTKPPGQGTGLGLSISHAIVQAHGGSITVESDGSNGTRVVIRLPASPTDS